MSTQHEEITRRLEDELHPLLFSGHEKVLRQTHPRAFWGRLSALWNKELEVPLKPLGAMAAVIVAGAVILYSPQPQSRTGVHQATVQPEQRELIQAGGNTYWKDSYERAVKLHEN